MPIKNKKGERKYDKASLGTWMIFFFSKNDDQGFEPINNNRPIVN